MSGMDCCFVRHELPGDHDVHADWRDGPSLRMFSARAARGRSVPFAAEVNVVNSVAASEREGSTARVSESAGLPSLDGSCFVEA